jgi:hypothetical protein
MLDGSPVDDPEIWKTRRRLEILELFRTHVFGLSRGRPAQMTFTATVIDREAIEGAATRKDIVVNFAGAPDGPKMDMRLYVPNNATKPRSARTFCEPQLGFSRSHWEAPRFTHRRQSWN